MEAVAIGLGLLAVLFVMVEIGTLVLVLMALAVAVNVLPGWMILVVVIGYVGLEALRDRQMIEAHNCPTCRRQF